MNELSPARAMKPDVQPGPHAGMGFREFVAMNAAMMAMMALGIDTMLPALPQIGAALDVASENHRQWIITSYVLGFGLATIVYGPVSDRYGRKPLILGGMIGYTICSVGIAFAPSFAALLALRALQGVAIAAVRVVATSMVRDCYGGRQMARVMSLSMMIFLAVPILAPSLGQVIMLVFPWRGLFLVLAVYGALLLAWTMLRLPETLHPDYRRPIDARAIGSGIATAVTTRQAAGYMVVLALLQGTMLGFISSIQQIFADTFRAPWLMPPMFAAMAGTMMLASLLNSRIVERFGTRRVGHAAVIGYTVVQAMHLVLALAGAETIVTFTVCQALALGFFGLCAGNFGALAMEPLARLAGTAASVQSFVMMVGGTAIGTAIGQSFDGTTVPMATGNALCGAGAIALILWTERGRLFRPQMGG